MSLWRQLAHGLRTLTDRSGVEAELDDEVRDYFERARADLVRQGLTPEEAARAARRELGDLAKAQETLRSYGWENELDATLGDFRQSIRRLRQNPGFAAVVVLTLAVGIGVNVALFSLFQQILLRPLPVAEPDRLVNLSDPGPKLDPKNGIGAFASSVSGGPETVFSYPMFRDLERRNRSWMRTDPAKTLQAHGARQTSGKKVTRFRMALGTMQVALSMALLAMAGVFAQSLASIARIDLGLDVDSVVTFSISPRTSGYSPEASDRLLDDLQDELEALPGVSSVASSSAALLSGGDDATLVRAVEGVDVEELVSSNTITPSFFRTLGIELLAGRNFSDSETVPGPAPGPGDVVIVNQRFAERFGLDRDVVGAQIRFTTRRGENLRIIGLVADAKYGNVTGEIGPQLFLPARRNGNFYIRAARPPEDLIDAIRATIARVAPVLPVTNLHTMEQQVRENLVTERFVAGTSTAFAVLATMLAGIGLYGVLAYGVAQRSREIAVRFALGASAIRIRGMVLRQVAIMATVGVALGVAAAWLLGRAAESLLFGVGAAEPVALAGAAIVLAVVMLGAACVPTRRASRVDPMAVLRYE